MLPSRILFTEGLEPPLVEVDPMGAEIMIFTHSIVRLEFKTLGVEVFRPLLCFCKINDPYQEDQICIHPIYLQVVIVWLRIHVQIQPSSPSKPKWICSNKQTKCECVISCVKHHIWDHISMSTFKWTFCISIHTGTLIFKQCGQCPLYELRLHFIHCSRHKAIINE